MSIPEALQLLLIEDNPFDALMVQDSLASDLSHRLSITHVERLAAGLERLKSPGIQVVLMDLDLPDSNGLETFLAVRRQAPDLPVIILSGSDDEQVARQALDAGAHDYVIKGLMHDQALRNLVWHAVQQHSTMSALERKAGQLQTLVQAAPDAMLVVDADGRLLFVNAAGAALLGRPAQDLVGQPVGFPIFSQDWAEMEISPWGAAGQPTPVELHVADIEWAGAPARLATLHDLSARRQAQEDLAARERRFRALYEGSWDVMVHSDANGRVLYASPSIQHILGYDERELLGSTPLGLIHPEDQERVITYLADSVARPGRSAVHRYRLRHKDGSWRWLDLMATNLLDDPAVAAIVLHFRDVTDRTEAEAALARSREEVAAMTEQLWQTAKLATMGELVASIAHELNNPLATVSLRLESALAQLEAGGQIRASLQIAAEEVERVARLVRDMLTFSRRNTRQVSTLDLRDEIEKTLELIRSVLLNNRVEAVTEFAPDAPLIQADREHMRQIFLNLFTNAIDAMPNGGTLTVRVRPEASHLLVEVSDTGAGIRPEDIGRVAEPFFTTKPEGKGTGLGLAICRRIVEEHGGEMEIVSEGIYGKGTAVRLRLPQVASRADAGLA